MNARTIPLRLSLLRRLRDGGPHERRMQRYIISGLVCCVLAWALSLAYLVLTPRSYTSGFVLVLPGTGTGSTLNLPTVGQVTSTSTPAFGGHDLSPTENYRKMLMSNRLIGMAAEAAGETADRFPPPKVELTDQTKLIGIKLTGRSPEQARTRAEAVRLGFLKMLDDLRSDEIVMRDTAYRTMLGGYKEALNESRKRLTDYQASTGLMSLDQYGSIVAGTERLRDMLRDVEAKQANLRAGVQSLTRQLGITPEQASLALVFRSDPLFQALVTQLAKTDAELAALTGTRGQNNDRVVDLQAERGSTVARLIARASELSGTKRQDVLKMRDLSSQDERARLFERLVGQIADTEAMAAMQEQLKTQLVTEQARSMALAPVASRLDDLRRDVQVAEAVFSSALARIDTSKADFYASYPMAQTLEVPDLPAKPSSPLPILAVAGGLAATLLILAALVLTWLRTALLQRILKSA